MDGGRDQSYARLRRRFGLRAAAVAGASLLASVAAIVSSSGGASAAYRSALVPATSLGRSSSGPCRSSDLVGASPLGMPVPEMVTRQLLVRPGPDLESLSPPDRSPAITAAAAWSAMRRAGFRALTSTANSQVLLGDLYAATPVGALTGEPVYAHTLVWAIYGWHQPETPAIRGAADCFFESAVFYVDAKTGRPLIGEVFMPGGDSVPVGVV